MRLITFRITPGLCFLILALSSGVPTLPVLRASGTSASTTLRYAEEPDWFAPALGYVKKGLESSPPAFPASVARQEALMLLDGPLHLDRANRFQSAHEFLLDRVSRAVEDIEKTRITTGSKIWKLYNHGFVVRTPSVTIGMDLVRGWWAPEGPDGKWQRFGISQELASRLIAQIDVLTLSHVHGDHSEPEMRDLAFGRGIPVVADASIYPEITTNPLLVRPVRAESGRAGDTAKPAQFTTLELGRGVRIEFIAYAGHQGPDAINNVYLVQTAEGLSFMHTGDQACEADWIWLDRVARQHRVDVLMVNCWTDNLTRMIRGVKPKLVLTGHENEMGHAPDHREAFWRSYQCFRGLETQPHCVMCWGEGISYP